MSLGRKIRSTTKKNLEDAVDRKLKDNSGNNIMDANAKFKVAKHCNSITYPDINSITLDKGLSTGDYFAEGEYDNFNKLFEGYSIKCTKSIVWNDRLPVGDKYKVVIYECPDCIHEISEKQMQEQKKLDEIDLEFINALQDGMLCALFCDFSLKDSKAMSWQRKDGATKFLYLCRFNKKETLQSKHVTWEIISDKI